jgi:predicted DNA-binding protein YlxM (UPF0122 family)
MSARPHNKKRNTGVIYEQLLKSVSKCLVEGDRKRAQVCLNIIERHFRQGTELYREFRLFNALANAEISSSPVAAVIITEARDAARQADRGQLESEKGRLIAEINRSLGQDFYDTHFDRYREYATIQVLLNSWRTPNTDLSAVFDYERKLVSGMLQEKKTVRPEEISPEHQGDISSLVVSIMTEKLNSKFSTTLTDQQRQIIKEYVFSPPGSDQTSLKKIMSEIKRQAVRDLDDYTSREMNEYITSRAGDVKLMLESLDADVIDDEAVVKFLTASKLSQEISGSET